MSKLIILVIPKNVTIGNLSKNKKTSGGSGFPQGHSDFKL